MTVKKMEGEMKKIILAFTLIFLAASYAAAQEQATPGQKMRVIVEGEEQSAIANDLQKPVLIKTEKKKATSASDLKAMAEKASMENEIIDAMIAKMTDMEAQIKSLQNNFVICTLLLLGALIMLVALVIKKKK